MAKWCLRPEFVDKFKQGLREGSINPMKLAQMASEERNKYLADFVGKENSTQVNSLFESKLLLKNQQAGYISWARKIAGLTPEAKRDLISRIEKMDRVLSPQEGEQFLKDLAQTRLGVGVSESEAKNIYDLSTKIKEAKTLQKEDLTFPSETQRLDYGRTKVALTNYVNDLKQNANKLSLKERLNPNKTFRNISDVAGNAKSIKASMDNSAIFRQGWKTLFTNPLIWQKNARQSFVDLVKTFGGKKVMDELTADIISRPTYDLMTKAKLAIGTIEEAYPGTIIEKAPILGRVYKASENAYTGFVYRQRADIFDKYIQIAQNSGVNIKDPKELQAIGSLVNSLTGRGNLGKYEGSAANLLNNVFFSPRFMKSQFDTIGHVVTGAGGSNFVRKQAAINLIKVVSGTATILAVADAMAPGSVEWDPRSSDFGNIKIGNTRFDVTGGMSGMVTLAARVAPLLIGQPASSKSSTTGQVTPINSGKYGAITGTDVVTNFFQNKLAPVGGMIKDLLNGQDFNGNKPTPESILSGLFTPITATTYGQISKDPNGPNAILGTILDGLGIGANTYLPKPQKENNWIDSPTKAQSAFLNKVGETDFKKANQLFDTRYNDWLKNVQNNPTYKNLDPNKKAGVNQSARNTIQEGVFKQYHFIYKAAPQDKIQQKQLEQIKPKSVTQAIIDKLIPSAYASEDSGLFGSVSYKTDFKTNTTEVTRNQGIIEKIIGAVTSLFNKKPETPIAQSTPKPTVQPTQTPLPTPAPTQKPITVSNEKLASNISNTWKDTPLVKNLDLYTQAGDKLKAIGLDPLLPIALALRETQGGKDLIDSSKNSKLGTNNVYNFRNDTGAFQNYPDLQTAILGNLDKGGNSGGLVGLLTGAKESSKNIYADFRKSHDYKDLFKHWSPESDNNGTLEDQVKNIQYILDKLNAQS